MVEATSLAFGIALILVFVYSVIKSRYSFFSSRGIPGPEPLPILGNMLDSHEKPAFDVYTKYQKTYGNIFGTYDALTPKLVVTDIDLLKKIMVSDFSHFTDRRVQGFDHPFEQLMMFVLEGEEWRNMRQTCSPAFSSGKIKAMVPIMYECTDKMIRELRNKTANGKDGIEVKWLFNCFALDVIGRAGFGVEFDNYHPETLDPRMKKALTYFVPNNIKFVLSRLLPKWFKTAINFSVFDKDGLNAFISLARDIVIERRRTLDQKRNAKYTDFITILLETEKNEGGKVKLTENQVIANAFLFLAAGFFTTALHLAITAFLLARHPNQQKKLREEISEAVSKDGKGVESLTSEVVMGMKYLDSVIKESFRLYPPSCYTERKVCRDYEMDSPDVNIKAKVVIPKETLVYIPIYTIHHDKENWKNPEDFNPDRFMPDNRDNIEPFAYMPFGQGPRQCIAMRFAEVEIKIAIARLIHLFDFGCCEKTQPNPLDLTETNDEMILTPDIHLTFTPREN